MDSWAESEKQYYAVIEGLISGLTGRVTQVEANVNEINRNITILQTDIKRLSEDIESLEEHEIADRNVITAFTGRVGIVKGIIEGLSVRISNLEEVIANIGETLEANAQIINLINGELKWCEHFRSYFDSTATILTFDTPVNDDYPYNTETDMKWVYNESVWVNSMVTVPDQTISTTLVVPLMNGIDGIDTDGGDAQRD